MMAPITGCEGSTWYSRKNKVLYYIGPSSKLHFLYRRDMRLFESHDEGKSWVSKYIFTSEMAGYSALAEMDGKLVGLIEEAPGYQLAIVPTKFTFVNFDIEV